MSRDVVLCGNFVHSTGGEYMKVEKDYCIGVKNGKIIFFEPEKKLRECMRSHYVNGCKEKRLHQHQFVMPGMVDTHIHASQYPNAGKGLDLQLLDWLNTYTFPTETKYSDPKFAGDVYDKVVRCVLRNGTTTACYFATIHSDSTLLLCDQIEKYGQRALVGKVNMDRNSPENYIESTKASLSDTKRFVNEIKKRENPRVLPVITPRFAASCTPELMTGLAHIARANDLHIQTHISENLDEIAWIEELFPDRKDYVDVYDKMGLLTEKTVLAHGIYLSKRERRVIKERGSSISHCPNSNISIRSGLFDARRALHEDVKVGLGTDVSAGYSPSILDSMRTAIHISNTLAIQNRDYKPITHKEAFMMATLGGAKALAMDDKIGNFEVGKEFDALVINIDTPDSQIDIFEDESVEESIQKFICLGDSRNIETIYVSGENVTCNLQK